MGGFLRTFQNIGSSCMFPRILLFYMFSEIQVRNIQVQAVDLKLELTDGPPGGATPSF